MHPVVLSLAPILLSTGLWGTQQPSELSQELQRGLAERFAPVLVFHEAEEFFPCSPFFVLDLAGPGASDGNGGSSRSAVLDVLGDVESRTDVYRSLSRAERAGLARVFFQAYPFFEDGERRVVVEYWLYYVQNLYRARGGIFPVRVDTSHPNDLEHIFVVLRPLAGGVGAASLPESADDYTIEKIHASAHHGNLPTNTYSFPSGRGASHSPPFVVELGSHAVAPDIDGDGRFKPEIDAKTHGKFLWGIRDNGSSWAAYDQTYMDPRGGGNALVLSPRRGGSSVFDTPADGPGATRAGTTSGYVYRLEHASTLGSTLEHLALSEAEIDRAFRAPVAWHKRFFGRSNGHPDKLLIPSRHENYGNPGRLENGYVDLERGVNAGYTNILYSATFFVGARYALINNSRIVPDLVAEGQVLVTAEGNDYYELELLGYYPIDTTSKVFAGASLITDDIRFDKRQYDFLGGIEFKLSSFRFRTAYRTTGSVSRAKVDFRFYYFLF